MWRSRGGVHAACGAQMLKVLMCEECTKFLQAMLHECLSFFSFLGSSQALGDAYSVLSDDTLREKYDTQGLEALKDEKLPTIEPTVFFSLLFGSELFDGYTGDMTIAVMAKSFMKELDAEEQQERKGQGKGGGATGGGATGPGAAGGSSSSGGPPGGSSSDPPPLALGMGNYDPYGVGGGNPNPNQPGGFGPQAAAASGTGREYAQSSATAPGGRSAPKVSPRGSSSSQTTPPPGTSTSHSTPGVPPNQPRPAGPGGPPDPLSPSSRQELDDHIKDLKFKRKQWRRQVRCSLYLRDRLEVYVGYRALDRFKQDILRESVQDLVKASFGKELLGVLGDLYCIRASIFLGEELKGRWSLAKMSAAHKAWSKKWENRLGIAGAGYGALKEVGVEQERG